jgi:Uma2 family endonuclease
MILLHVDGLHISDEAFFRLCTANRDLRLERTAQGDLVIMAPAGGDTSARNSSLTGQLWVWNRTTRLGQTFDSSGGFRLPNGADRSPDAAWVSQARWDALTPDQKRRFPPLCPDFVVELRSPSDDLKPLQNKMEEYLANGAQLGWLIDPAHQQVEIYRLQQPVEVVVQPTTLSGEPLLPGFVLDLSDIL